MTQQTLDAPFEIKALDEPGSFEGYASLFDAVDRARDVMSPGAFGKSSYGDPRIASDIATACQLGAIRAGRAIALGLLALVGFGRIVGRRGGRRGTFG